jgi:cytochrome c556
VRYRREPADEASESAGMRFPRSTIPGAALAVVMFLAAAACGGSSSKSASQQVCDARSDFSSAVSKVGDDLGAFNLSAASSDASTVQSTFNTLVDSVNKLTQEQRQKLQPQIDQVKSDLSSFSNVGNSDELKSAIDTTKSDVQAVVDGVQGDLSC